MRSSLENSEVMDRIVNYDDDHHSEDDSVQQNDHQNMNMNQNVPQQEAPNSGLVGVPQIDHAMMMQLLQQVLIMNQNALAHVRQPEPRITLERLQKNGAEEFLSENIADPLIAFRWIERVRRVFENLKVPASEWADFAVMLLQGNAYEWWKRTTRDANHPAKVTWAYFEQVFKEEYIPESFVEEKREEFLHLEMGTMSLPEYRQLFDHLAEFGQDLVNTTKRRCDKFVKGMCPKLQKHMSTASRQDFGVMYEQAKEVVRTKEGLKLNTEQKPAKTSTQAASTSKVFHEKRSQSEYEIQVSKKAKSMPTQSVVSTSKGKQPRHPLCPRCNRYHPGECWWTLGLSQSQRTTAGSHVQRPQQQRPPQAATEQHAIAPARTYAMHGQIDPNPDADYVGTAADCRHASFEFRKQSSW
ncbi:unnamed protein product [Cuscuta campestris]|uniref:Retrotransposon gag domain-containing protein n=1 Tax=Cuscuta campestris TaxID=132261 RepID=A0A484KRY2_9ASTE|nr:unnamed protein product [Cuscuta campestris]